VANNTIGMADGGSDTASGSIVITDGAGAPQPLSWAVRLGLPGRGQYDNGSGQ